MIPVSAPDACGVSAFTAESWNGMAGRPGDHTLVRVRTFLNRQEAEIAKSALAAAAERVLTAF